MAAPPRTGMAEAALAYAALGWSVIPVQPRAKRPLVAWRSFQQQAADAAQIERWFAHWPDANVGIVTGQVSGLVVVDVDAGHGGEASLAAVLARYGPLPTTVQARTGGGGRHLYFAHPGGHCPNRAGVLPGIDIRGDGGCVVAPPSVHPSGVAYAWVRGCAPGESPIAALPPAFGLLPHPAHGPGHTLEHWRVLAREGVDEGQRNSTLASLAGHLLWHGVDPEVALELLWAWNRTRCRPPLPDEEVAAVVHSITRLHARDPDAA